MPLDERGIRECLAGVAAAVEHDDPKAALSLALDLAANLLADINRTANTLEKIEAHLSVP